MEAQNLKSQEYSYNIDDKQLLGIRYNIKRVVAFVDHKFF